MNKPADVPSSRSVVGIDSTVSEIVARVRTGEVLTLSDGERTIAEVRPLDPRTASLDQRRARLSAWLATTADRPVLDARKTLRDEIYDYLD